MRDFAVCSVDGEDAAADPETACDTCGAIIAEHLDARYYIHGTCPRTVTP